MPWEARSVMEQRISFIVALLQGDRSKRQVCEDHQVSRPTGGLWLQRFRESQSFAGLSDRSRRPLHSPAKTDYEREAMVVALYEEYGYGARTLKPMLTLEGVDLSESTINRIITRHGLRASGVRKAVTKTRFEKSASNEMHQMDFKGDYPVLGGRCHPLTLLDDHSRYLIGLWPLADQKANSVFVVLKQQFQSHGVPVSMLMDHGTPWWGTTNGYGLSWLSVWLMKQDIRLIYSGVAHPQTQGKVERFHLTLKRRTAHRGEPSSLTEWQQWAEVFRREYNEQRPHEALQMSTPSQVYKLDNLRQYNENPGHWDYCHLRTQIIDQLGMLSYRGVRYFVCEALKGEIVGLIEQNGLILIQFRQMIIREIDIRRGTSRPVVMPKLQDRM